MMSPSRPYSAGEDINPPVDASATSAVSGGAASPKIPEAAPPDFIPVSAMEAMLQIRHQQIHQFGHTLDADRARPTLDFARDIENAARAILEDAQFKKPANRLRKRAIKLGALLMAFADKLEGEGE